MFPNDDAFNAALLGLMKLAQTSARVAARPAKKRGKLSRTLRIRSGEKSVFANLIAIESVSLNLIERFCRIVGSCPRMVNLDVVTIASHILIHIALTTNQTSAG